MFDVFLFAIQLKAGWLVLKKKATFPKQKKQPDTLRKLKKHVQRPQGNNDWKDPSPFPALYTMGDQPTPV